MTDILKINEKVKPKFPKHVKFRHNKARNEWVILAPERLVKLDDIAVEILKLVDGNYTVNEISQKLSEKFNAIFLPITPMPTIPIVSLMRGF